jgi:Glycosyltransferase 61
MTMGRLLQISHMLRAKLSPGSVRSIEQVASRTWEIAPGTTTTTPRAYFLPGQLERVTGWAFAEHHPRKEMEGGAIEHHGPTRAAQIDDAWLLDGVLYKGAAALHLRPRSTRWPQRHIDHELDRAAIYCTPQGNRYFGSWLMDDCPRYPLAEHEGTPVTTSGPTSAHMLQYEQLLGMRPLRLRNAALRRVVVFDDVGQNRDRHRRFRAMSERLLTPLHAAAHPGVFLLRGVAGERRVLRNELELAERLQRERGFRLLDPLREDVATIVATCAGARTVIGVEGSALIHGVLGLAPGGSLVVLQPPHRFCSVFKHLTDRDGQHFGFVVGTPIGEDFHVAADELERTLDLLPQATS